MLKTRAVFLICVSLLGTAPILAQDPADIKAKVRKEGQDSAEINAKIRKEGNENSQIMRTMHFLTDVYGPRLTGSPNLRAAGEWAANRMRSWGFENAHLEPWDFGHPGWVNERLTAHIISPVKDALVGEVLAWTPGTSGVVAAQAYQL